MKVYEAPPFDPESDAKLKVNAALVARWLTRFLEEECIRQRGMKKAVLGLSGGVDSAVSAYLCARAFGAENVWAVRMPYKISSPESLSHAQLVIDALGLNETTVDITAMVDGYVLQSEVDMSPLRLGNVCARCRMTVLYDQSAELGALPIGTSNKTERLFGYFTWHADDAPAVNPLGDLFKTQVWQLARELGVPEVIVAKAPSADLVKGQTDEGDFGISYHEADRILVHLVAGAKAETLVSWGFDPQKVRLVYEKVARSHWKRHLPTTAMLTDSAINEYYLRPVDF
ncbi:MAG: NAD+ synthase [Armatimonadetes bacterium]|nr:NAD+ synthase [Armatimonadota bacterium]